MASSSEHDGASPSDLPGLNQSQSRGLFFSATGETTDLGPMHLEPGEDSLHLVTEADAAGGSDSADPWSDLDPSDDEPRTSTASLDGDRSARPAQLLGQRQMRKTGEQAVKIGAGMAHTVAANTKAKQDVGLYLADDEDAVNIGHPLADIFHRRGDVVGGKLSPDANDALRALMGFAGYFTKQIAKLGEVRQIEAAAVSEPQTFGTAA